MKKAMTIAYAVGNHLYLNITNQCTCHCIFCIRKNDDGAYGSDPLWLEHEPDMQEAISAIRQINISQYQEIVFCGYGEPLMRLEFVCELAAWLKQNYPSVCLRLNSNGLADIYHPCDKSAAEKIAPYFDKVSVSLNAGNAETYLKVTAPLYRPANAYDTMLQFALSCKNYGIDTRFTIVDVISPEEIQEAQAVAQKLGIPLHIRQYIA